MVNKKIFMSLVVLVAIIGLASAGTFAYFSDSASSNGNKITTGTIDLTVGGQAALAPFVFGPIVPGDSVTNQLAATFQNDGTVAGDLIVDIDMSGAPALYTSSVTIGGVSHTLVNGPNHIEVGKLDIGSGYKKDMTFSFNFAESGGSGQTGQGATIAYDSTFMLKSNPTYTLI